jgi:cytochrome c peroxidase
MSQSPCVLFPRFAAPVVVALIGLATCLAAEPERVPSNLAIHLVGHEDWPLLLRVQDVIDDWDPRRLVNPIVEVSEAQDENHLVVERRELKRPDLGEFIADVAAAEALGKMFFWEMRAGSDFRRLADGKTYVGTACASCHYRFGADARRRHVQRLPLVAWDKYKLEPRPGETEAGLEFGEQQQAYDVEQSITREVPVNRLALRAPFSTIIGSQGVVPAEFDGLADPPDPTGAWNSEKSKPWTTVTEVDEHTMFIHRGDNQGPDKPYRQITARNAPTVINSGFSDRLFHDGRAESTFNGFSIFGDADEREVIYRRDLDSRRAIPVKVAITKAALASQSMGPIVNEVEMSYRGRKFPDLARKLLDAHPLAHQQVSETDSLLKPWLPHWVGPDARHSYRDLIRRAFRSEWWADKNESELRDVPLELSRNDTDADDAAAPLGSIMEANFPLYWGLSLMLYQSSLVSNQTPFDAMMRGDASRVNERFEHEQEQGAFQGIPRDQKLLAPPPAEGTDPPSALNLTHTTGSSLFQHGFRAFLRSGCVDCHAGPLFSETSARRPEPQIVGIHYQLERTLLPNSRADALALRRQAAHQKVLARVAALLRTWNPPIASQALRMALDLDLLREQSFGRKARLEELVTNALRAISTTHPAAETAHQIAQVFMDFEKHVVEELGDRTFFSEEERYQLILSLIPAVGIERGRLPPDVVPLRWPLPIHGPGPLRPLFFYDLGFYNLGVAPSRYDRGIGAIVSEPSEPRTLVEIFNRAVDQLSLNPATAELAKLIRELDLSNRQKEAIVNAFRKGDRSNAAVTALLSQLQPKSRLSNEVVAAQLSAAVAPTEMQSKTSQAKDRTYRSAAGRRPAGSAYELKRVWRKIQDDQRESQLEQLAAEPAAKDNSWSRSDIDNEERRSEKHFLSRARELVSDESFWGHRKPFLHDNELMFWGAFRTPTLRNVELTAPYMHNGRLVTLRNVIEFYDRDEEEDESPAVPRDKVYNPDLHPAMRPLDLTEADKLALHFFLLCLTDPRVRLEQGPFDHPSLNLVHGYKSKDTNDEIIVTVPEIGREGHSPVQAPAPFPADR